MYGKIKELKIPNWKVIFIFYLVAFGMTYAFLKLPNLLRKVSLVLLDFAPPFNWNHGIALFVVSLVAYRVFKLPKKTTFLGKDPIQSLVFSLVFLGSYSIVGISNNFGINDHLWALIFCSLTLVYDIFEESAWRGFLNDAFGTSAFWLKTTITGILWGAWHFLIFDNFEAWGGFLFFLILSVAVSFIISYATVKTNSVLVAASVHALLINNNIGVTIFCLVVWSLMILFWKKNSINKNLRYVLRVDWGKQGNKEL